MDSTKLKEKRAHRRLDIRLPLEYHKKGVGRCSVFRTMTVNVSTGGVYFETTDGDIQVGDALAFELGIPHGDSRFPLHGKIANVGKVVRTDVIEDQPTKNGPSCKRYGVASQFQEAFKLTF